MTKYCDVEEWVIGDHARKMILAVMEARFGSVPADLGQILERIQSLEILDQLISQAAVVEDIETYEKAVKERLTS